MSYQLPYFDPLDLNHLEDYLEAEMPFGEGEIDLDLNFEATRIAEDKLNPVKNFLGDMKAVVKIAEQAIKDDYKNGTDVKEYLHFHQEELDHGDIDKITTRADKKLPLEEQLLSMLRLQRVGFYPEDKEIFAVLDFTMDYDLSDQLLVVNMNAAREVEYITMES